MLAARYDFKMHGDDVESAVPEGRNSSKYCGGSYVLSKY